ncbi:MAG: hypothetical protein KKF44_09350 [Nanoarchaeota archaeon]|nr:hypothetical protein [Nanoarchaeota archaeon]
MAKQYKVRKRCLICKNVFYPSYAGSLYCNECKNKKVLGKKKAKKSVVKKVVKPKKTVKPTVKKKPVKKPVKAVKKKPVKKKNNSKKDF